MKVKLKKRTKRIVFYSFLFIVVSLGIYYLGSKVKPEDVVLAIEGLGFWTDVIYVILMASTFIIAPLSGTPVFFAGYLLFGSKVQIYTYFSALLSATINFWISKKWGRNLVSRMVGKKNMEKIDQFTEDHGIKSLVLLRLFQGHFHDFISYAYGLTNMKYLPFIIVSALAPIPWLLLWQLYIFKRIKNIGDFTIWWVATLIPFFIISAFLASKYKKKK